jgi:IS5 family transposase
MGPKPQREPNDHDLFRTKLVNLIDQRHELVRLAELIDWQAFSEQWSAQFTSTTGRPALPTRLMAALLYLKHAHALSDEEVVERWTENPYQQHFSGDKYFRHALPCDPSSLVAPAHRRSRLRMAAGAQHRGGEEDGCGQTRQLRQGGAGHHRTPPAIAHPTDSRLLNRAREQLVQAARNADIDLRQS